MLPDKGGQWPWTTFTVNIVGAFMLGYFTTRLQERLPLSSYRRPFLGTGICGALTTFSTYFGERDRANGGFLADAFADIYARHDVQTSLVMRGIEGFGAKQHLRTDRLLTLSEDLPLVSVAVDTRPPASTPSWPTSASCTSTVWSRWSAPGCSPTASTRCGCRRSSTRPPS